jgi:hypothetical protein
LIELVPEGERSDPELGLDAIRLELVRRMFERTQASRGFLLAADQDQAKAALDPPVWVEAWEAAVARVAQRVPAVIAARLERARARSGLPLRRLKALLPTADEVKVLEAKLGAAGIPLEQALSRSTLGSGWWDEIRRRAGALEESWDQLENVVRLELAAAATRIEEVEHWRPSPRAPLVIGGLLALVLIWLGLAIGGLVPRPPLLDPLTDWFWSLPWP